MAAQKTLLAILIGAWTFATVLPGHAEEAGEQKKVVIGAGTDGMLSLQREGKSAGATQPILGEVATRTYNRYLQSFEKPMPEFNATVGSSAQSGNAK